MYFSKVPSAFKIIYSKAIWSSLSDQRLRLTFDDGPNPESTLRLLEILQEKQLKAPFFCLGKQAERYPELIDAISAAGHQLGYHGYAHLSGWRTSTKAYIEDLNKNLNHYRANLFRPAYGKISSAQFKYIREQLQLDIVFWTHMPGDFDKRISEEKLTQRIKTAYDLGNLIVLHDNPFCLNRNAAALLEL